MTNTTTKSPRITSVTTDGIKNPRWVNAAERFTLTTGRCVYLAVILDYPEGVHGRDHKGRSRFIPDGLIANRAPFIRKGA